jgi:hypothetical protein
MSWNVSTFFEKSLFYLMLQKIKPLLRNGEFVFVQIWRMNIVNDFVFQKKVQKTKKKKKKKNISRLNLGSR